MGIHKEFVSKAILTSYLHRSRINDIVFRRNRILFRIDFQFDYNFFHFRRHTNTIELNFVATLLPQYKLTESTSLWRNRVLC